MDFILKKIFIDSKYYGKVKAWVARKSKYGNSYLVFTRSGKKNLTGLIDESGNEIIPLQEMEYTGIIIANYGKDYLFEFTFYDSNIPQYYHIKDDGNCSKLVMETGRFDDVPLIVTPMKDTDDYWLLETTIGEPQYAVYDYKNAKIITTFVDEVCYQNDGGDPSHSFYFGYAITTRVKQPDGTNTAHIHTTLCGFLDKDGNLSSQLYDTESNQFYSSYEYGPDTLANNFNELVNLLSEGYNKLFYEKNDKIDSVLSYMYSNPNMSEKKKNYKDDKKILEYKPRKKV